MAQSLDVIVSEIVGRFERTNTVRDSALNAGRQVIRSSANAIRELHRGNLDGARSELRQASSLLARVRDESFSQPSVYWAGYVQDAMKEFSEANILFAIVSGGAIPSSCELNVEDTPYLNGLCEAASELRRLVLHTLRGENLDVAERYLKEMDEIYDVLITIDFSDAITGGLRRSADQLRAVLERTRGDFTLTSNQRRLETAIRAYRREILGE